jgi:hypothetical protein
VIKTLDGIDGFYIPKKAKGYMEITLLLSQNENSKTYCFKKGFDFAGNEDDSQVQIKKLFINDLTNFERLQF